MELLWDFFGLFVELLDERSLIFVCARLLLLFVAHFSKVFKGFCRERLLVVLLLILFDLVSFLLCLEGFLSFAQLNVDPFHQGQCHGNGELPFPALQ